MQFAYESFWHIYHTVGANPNDVLENRYKNKDALQNKFIVWSRQTGYRVYPKLDDFVRHLQSMSEEERIFHEVIMYQPQKLRFDVDAPKDKLDKFTIPTPIDYKNDTADNNPIYNLITSSIDDSALRLSIVDGDNDDIDALFGELLREDEDDIDDLFGELLSDCDTPNEKSIIMTEQYIEPSKNITSSGIDIRPLSNEQKYQNIFETILSAIRDAFFISYARDLSPNCEVICESKDPTGQKFSNHIIIDGYYVSSCEQAAEFARRVISYLPDIYHQFIDMSIYKRLQNFRLVNCHKEEDTRIKKIITAQPILSSIITCVSNCILLPDLVAEAKLTVFDTNLNINAEDEQKVLAICENSGILKYNIYKGVRDGIFRFDRTTATLCEFCDREHVKDNTVIVTLRCEDGIATVYKQCRKYLDEHGRDGQHFSILGEFSSDIINTTRTQAEKTIVSWADQKIIAAINSISNPHKLLFDDLSDAHKHIYNTSTLAPFEYARTLVIHAAMKMGKTKALTEYITQYFADTINVRKIIILSFRQTFSGNLKEKFADYTLYSDVKGKLDQMKLIIQVESLHRLDIREGVDPPDLVVLDECESIFEQFDSGLLRGNFADCFAKFQYLMRYSQYVICMDAMLTDRTYRMLTHMRTDPRSNNISMANICNNMPNNISESIFYHHNLYRNATADQYHFTGDKIKWLGILYSSIEADEKCVVVTSSLGEAKVLIRNLHKRYPEKSMRIYSSESSKSEKNEHFARVNDYWNGLDLLIYTPTVSAGVSFEEKHYQKMFCYFTDKSCPVETCIQMIGRIRDLADKQYYVYLAARGNSLPVTAEDIKKQLYNKRTNLMQGFDTTGLQITYAENGERIIHGGPYFTLWLENTRIRNLSRNQFIMRLIHNIAWTGAKTVHLSDDLFEQMVGQAARVDGKLNDELREIYLEHIATRKEIINAACAGMVAARDITEAEFDELHELIKSQREITEEQKCMFERYRLRSDYRYYHNIDADFVSKYRDPKVRRVYKNITRIGGISPMINRDDDVRKIIDDNLNQIQIEERETHKYLMSLGEENFYQDLNRRYVYDQHRYAIALLRLAGWEYLGDPRYIHKNQLAMNMRRGQKDPNQPNIEPPADGSLYWRNITDICNEFNIKRPIRPKGVFDIADPNQVLKVMLPTINRVLEIMYHTSIIAPRNDPDMYRLQRCELFTADPIVSETKHKPIIVVKQNTDGFTI